MLLQAGCNAAALRSRNGPLSAKENRAGGIRTRDLLNPIQAHYQAVLRPDLSDYSLRAEPLPNDFGKVPSVAQVLRKASINCGSSSL